MRRWKRQGALQVKMWRTGHGGGRALGIWRGNFSTFPFKLKKILTLFMQKKQELTGGMRLLETGGEMLCTSRIWKRGPVLSKPCEIQMHP